MKVGETLCVPNRRTWRTWLARHHSRKKEIWLVYFKKHTGRPRIPYNDAVEEALCFGWIDSTVKLIDKDRFAQRFTPRKPTSKLSAMNKERIRRLTRQKKMTAAGVAAVKHLLRGASPATQADDLGRAGAIIAPDVLQALRADKQIWRNFRKFPASYKRIRLGWVEGARNRPEIFRKRLAYFLEMTAKNTRFGMVQ